MTDQTAAATTAKKAVDEAADTVQATTAATVGQIAQSARGALSTVNEAVHSAAEKSAAVVKDATAKAQALAGEAGTVAKDVVAGDVDPIRALAKLGVKSGHLYTAGVLSIGLSWGSWLLSRARNEPKGQSDRNGLYVGLWAPTLFSVGLALRHEEKATRRRTPVA